MTERLLEILIRKYTRIILTRLEENSLQNLLIRKIVLDGINDLKRELEDTLRVK